MSEADRLYEQYRRELQRLQEACPHEQLTDWVEEWWAPGHGTGREVRACANCNKVVQARRQCHGCSKFFLEGELKQGDGHILPIGSWYCAACHREKAARETGRQGQGG